MSAAWARLQTTASMRLRWSASSTAFRALALILLCCSWWRIKATVFSTSAFRLDPFATFQASTHW